MHQQWISVSLVLSTWSGLFSDLLWNICSNLTCFPWCFYFTVRSPWVGERNDVVPVHFESNEPCVSRFLPWHIFRLVRWIDKMILIRYKMVWRLPPITHLWFQQKIVSTIIALVTRTLIGSNLNSFIILSYLPKTEICLMCSVTSFWDISIVLLVGRGTLIGKVQCN